jgi:hypothetical protein
MKSKYELLIFVIQIWNPIFHNSRSKNLLLLFLSCMYAFKDGYVETVDIDSLSRLYRSISLGN